MINVILRKPYAAKVIDSLLDCDIMKMVVAPLQYQSIDNALLVKEKRSE